MTTTPIRPKPTPNVEVKPTNDPARAEALGRWVRRLAPVRVQVAS